MKFNNLKILTIDDSPMIQTIIKNILISYEVDRNNIYQAGDGAAGLVLAEQKNLDVILCDLSMEPMDGFEFVKRLRSHPNEQIRDKPVIVLTVHGEQAVVAKAGKLAIDGYMLKPISPVTLRQRITQVLSKPE